MSLVRIDPATFGGLKGKVVVITGTREKQLLTSFALIWNQVVQTE